MRLILLHIVVLTGSIAAQSVTLTERAAREPGPIIKAVGIEEESRPFESIARSADVVVRGVVRPVASYLSEDQTLIYTDYELSTPQIVAGRNDAARRVPLTIKQLGGKLQIHGVEVTVINEMLDPLPVGTPVVLFLEREDGTAKFRIVGEHWGAFAVRGGAITPLMKGPSLHDRQFGVTVTQFSEEIRRLRH